jgi:hypothetical protein
MARRLMLATSMVVDGPVDLNPERSDKRLVHCLYMGQASLIIVGTACRRPLLLREVAKINAAANLDVVLVRAEDNAAQATFDLKLVGEKRMLCAYRMWMPRPSEAAWLVPTAGEDRYIRLTPLGLEARSAAPFADEAERHIGLVRGAEFLSVAVQGWF